MPRPGLPGQPVPADPWHGPSIPPGFLGTLPDSSSLNGAIVSPDGETVWVVADVPVVDIGLLLNQHAPKLAAAAASLAALLLLIWVLRSGRRRRTVGALHCRRCDYDVTTIIAAALPVPALPCPECGVDLLRRWPRKGLRKLRRIGPPLALLALVATAATWYFIFGRAAHPSPFPVGRWASLTLQGWCRTAGLTWLQRAEVWGEAVYDCDARTGQPRRTIAVRAALTHFAVEYIAAAHALLLADGTDGAALVSLQNGSVIARVSGYPASGGGEGLSYLAGQSGDGRLLWLSCAQGRSRESSWLAEWDWQAGTARRVADAEAYTRADGSKWVRHFLRIPGTPLRFLRYPDFMEAYDRKSTEVAVLDDQGRVLLQRDLGPSLNSSPFPSFSTDGSLLFFSDEYMFAVLAFSTADLTPQGSLGVGSGWFWRAHRSDGRLMLVPLHDGILIRDVQAKQNAGLLTHGDEAFAPHSIHFSQDGRTVCATFQTRKSGFMLGIWRLPPSLGIKPSAP